MCNLWGLVKVQVLMQEAWGGLDSSFLTRSQGMLMLVPGPHSEQQGPCVPLGEGKKRHLDSHSFKLTEGRAWHAP